MFGVLRAHLGQSQTCRRIGWSQCCPCGSSPPPAAPDAASGVSAPAVADPRCAGLSYRPPLTSAQTEKTIQESCCLRARVHIHTSLSETLQSLKHTVLPTPRRAVDKCPLPTACTQTLTLIWSLAFISRLRVVCLLASGPKGTRDFRRSKHSRRCARLERKKGGKDEGLWRKTYATNYILKWIKWSKLE